VKAIRVLYESDLEEMEDYIWRSLVPDMRSKIRPIAEHSIRKDGSDSAIDLNEYPVETPYDLRSIDAVYDLDSDPRRLHNLFDSYNDATKIIQLISPIPDGNAVQIRFLYRPNVVVTTGQDYIELDKVPEIILDAIEQRDDIQNPSYMDYVLNKRSGQGMSVPCTQSDIHITLRWVTDKEKDSARLADAIKRYFAQNTLLRSVGQDEDFTIWPLTNYEQLSTSNQKDLHTGKCEIVISKATFFNDEGQPISGVLRFNLGLAKRGFPPDVRPRWPLEVLIQDVAEVSEAFAAESQYSRTSSDVVSIQSSTGVLLEVVLLDTVGVSDSVEGGGEYILDAIAVSELMVIELTSGAEFVLGNGNQVVANGNPVTATAP
jgi:hypothetical protein